jgi:protease IV
MSETDPLPEKEPVLLGQLPPVDEPAAAEPAAASIPTATAPEAGSYVPPPYVPPPPPKKSRGGMLFFGALSGCLILVVGMALLGLAFAGSRGERSSLSLSTNKIAVVTVEGEIFEARETVESLRKYADQATVKGIVLRINSPGGAIAPSQEIYSEVLRLREKHGKPIVASFDSVAASGGYYIAAGCDRIVANPGTITGSIGVILQWMDIEELVKWAKMKPETITSGPWKAAGSPYRQLTEQERQYFQRIVLQLHSQFVRAVATGRKGKLTEADVLRLADGRVFTGEEALAEKLIDELGSLHDAVAITARLAGVKGEPAMIYPRRHEGSLLDLLADGGDAESLIESFVKRRAPRFLYMWEASSATTR